MKTKKILSFMLAIVIVVSMTATLGITASAAIAHGTVTVGQTATFTIYGCSYVNDVRLKKSKKSNLKCKVLASTL